LLIYAYACFCYSQKEIFENFCVTNNELCKIFIGLAAKEWAMLLADIFSKVEVVKFLVTIMLLLLVNCN